MYVYIYIYILIYIYICIYTVFFWGGGGLKQIVVVGALKSHRQARSPTLLQVGDTGPSPRPSKGFLLYLGVFETQGPFFLISENWGALSGGGGVVPLRGCLFY